MSSLDDEDVEETLNGNDSPYISQSHFLHPSKFKSKKIPLYVTVIFLLVVVILASIGLISNDSSSSDSNSQVLSPTEKGNIQNQRQVQTIEQTDSKCVRHTPQYYLDQLPDNINDLCKLEEKPREAFLGMTECGIGTNKYINNFCLCDINSHCGRFDAPGRTDCFKCKNEDHCPCQNGGTCNSCQHTRDMVSCKCFNGTIGFYCTKITERLCHFIQENTTMTKEDCSTSNHVSCFSREYTQLLSCEWSKMFLNNYPPCSNDTVKNMGIKTTYQLTDALGKVGKQEKNSYTSHSPSNNFYIGIIVLSMLSIISLLLFIYKTWKER